MATYFIRTVGDDANAGTSAATAWRTIGKALGATGIASGDTVYIGAGVYRETVTVNMTSAVAETFVIGDVDGAQTGDAGEVQCTVYTTHNRGTPVSSSIINLNGRDYLTFKNIVFVTGATVAIAATTTSSTNISFINCAFFSFLAGGFISVTAAAQAILAWVIDRCIFWGGSGVSILVTLTTGAGVADYDTNFQIRNSIFFTGATNHHINIASSGTAADEGGGVDVVGCTFIGAATGVNTTGTRVSLTYPVTVYNSVIFSGGDNAVAAGEAGAMLEDYNYLASSTPRSNVTAGAHSVSDGSLAALLHIGQERIWGGFPRLFGTPTWDSGILGFGTDGTHTAYDLNNNPRPAGQMRRLASGTATAAANKTLTDSGKTLGVNSLAGATIKITNGTGTSQVKSIPSNGTSIITVDGNWKTIPSTDSTYEVYWGDFATTGAPTAAGGSATLTDSNAAWGTNMWTGYVIEITDGVGASQNPLITSNTATVITASANWFTIPGTGSSYAIYRATNVNTLDTEIGALGRENTALRATSPVRTGSCSIKICGPGYHDFYVPVSPVSTTLSVFGRYDAPYGGNKPSMAVLPEGKIGIAGSTTSMGGAADTWEQLSVAFTPASAGVATIRLRSECSTVLGCAYFDDFAAA